MPGGANSASSGVDSTSLGFATAGEPRREVHATAGVVVALDEHHRAAGHTRVQLERKLELARELFELAHRAPRAGVGSTDTSMQPSPSHFAIRTPNSVAT